MPLYSFRCKSKKCGCVFEELCDKDGIDKLRCIECNGKRLEKLISLTSVHFANPRESSKWDNFNYRAEWLYNKAKKERRKAETISHVGATPYLDNEKIDIGEQDIKTHEGKIV